MPSRLDQLAAHDFRPTGGTAEAWEDVIRRIGGNAETTETVSAVVVFATDGGGLVTGPNGKLVSIVGRIEVAATQEVTARDTWVIQDGPNAGVYQQMGLPTAGDGGTKVVNLEKRISQIAGHPKIRAIK